MTIVAGFRVKDGVLLCADTMYSGDMKIYQPKIFRVETDEAKFGFALAGNEVYGKMAFQECQKAVEQCPVGERTKLRLIPILRDVLQAVAENYGNVKDPHLTRFDFLIAAWFKDGGAEFYYAQPPAMLSEGTFRCLGTGAYLGYHMITSAYEPDMPVHRALILATEALAASKGHDVNCGGKSEFLLVRNDGVFSDLAHFNVAAAEECIAEYNRLSQQLLLDLGSLRTEEMDFSHQFNGFEERIIGLRRTWKAKALTFHKLVEAARR